MIHAISLKSTNETAAEVFKLWDEVAVFEHTPSMRALNYPPHFTLAVYEECPSDPLDDVFDRAFGSQFEVSIDFSRISYFQNEFLVLWARPVVNDALLRMHAALHREIDSGICHEHYRPGNWVPHCTLATKVPQAKSAEALSWAKQSRKQFSVTFDTADCVRFPPVDVLTEVRLASR